MTQPHTVQATVDPHLLRELPRFFGGTSAIIREVIQNAVRAGATALRITLEGDVLTFTDNGRGLDDPQLLLSVARSGWGEGVVHPAGMGVLSVLSEDFSRTVTFSSRDWHFALNFEQFAGQAPIAVQHAPPQEGFTLSVTLAVVPRNIEELIAQARARAPLTVTLDGVELPPMTLGGPAFTLDWGRVILDTGTDAQLQAQVHSTGAVFWEGFPIPLDTAHRLGDVAAPATLSRKVVILPGAHSGISPTLPDRKTISDNAGLSAAMADITVAIETRVLGDLQGEDLSGPVIHNVKERAAKTPLATWCAQPEKVLEAVLTRLGFIWGHEYPTGFAIELDEDEDNDSARGVKKFMVRQDAAVYADPGQCAALGLLRPTFPALPVGSGVTGLGRDLDDLTLVTPGAPLPGVRALDPGERPRVRLVERIVVAGQELPWFIEDQTVLLAAGLDRALGLFGEWSAQIGTALLAQVWEGGLMREVFDLWADGSWSGSDVALDLRLDLIERYYPDLARRREERERLLQLQREVVNLRNLRKRLHHYGDRLNSDAGLQDVVDELGTQIAALSQGAATP